MSTMTRELWLQRAADKLKTMIEAEGFKVPRVHVSVGFPSKGATSTKRRVIGQCWSGTTSADGAPHLFISPVLKARDTILSTLLHEMIHAVVGTEAGHKGEFIVLAKKLGFTKPWTSTPSTPELQSRLVTLSTKLPEQDFPALEATSLRGAQKTRYRLYECEHGQKLRAATDTLAATCEECNSPFVLQVK